MAAALALAAGAHSVDAAIFVFSNPDGGAINVSTNYAPSGIPGSADTLRVSALPTIDGFLTLRVAANQTVGRLELNHFTPTTIISDVDGSNQPFILTLSTGQLAFTDAITDAPDVALDTLFLYSPIAGGSGLTKSGPGFAFLNGNNLYTGGTTINGPGGLSVTRDAALGAAGEGVFLTGGGTLRSYASFATSRVINISTVGGTASGRIESYGTLTLNGSITGSGTLTVGRFTGGAVTLNSTSNTFNGTLAIAQSNSVNLLGKLGSVSGITLGGTLNLGLGTTGPVVDAINDAAGINSLGGTVNVFARTTNSTESLGALTLTSGTTTINLEPTVNGGTQLNFASLARANRSTLFVRGRDLGNGALAANRALLTFSDTSSLPLVGGGAASGTSVSIVPFVFGNANATGGVSQASVVDAGLVTRTANGLRALDASNYATNPTTAGVNDNVRVTDTAFTLSAAKTINALVIRSTLNSASPSGIAGTGALTVTSGAIVAVSDLAGEELFIDNPVNFGAAEGVIHTAPTADGYSQLLLNGAISGSNGLTKSGGGDLSLNSVGSTYGGVTTINAGIVTITGDALNNTPGALGNSAADVVLNAGVTATQYTGLRTGTDGATVARNLVVRQNANANSLALIGTAGEFGATFSGQITLEGGFLNLLGNAANQALSLTGPVVGAGGLQEPGIALPLTQLIRVSGSNSYAGGTQIRSANWQVGSNTALGSGTVYFIGNGAADSVQTGAIEAFGGARTLNNAVVLRSGAVFGGTNPLTFTGAIDLGGTAREVNATNTADTTFAGVVGRGGLVKSGNGRLILSGPNTYNGQTIVNAGVLRAASNTALGVSTGPMGTAQATFVTGAASLEFAGGITSDETIFLGSDTALVTAGLPAGNLRNIAGNNILTGQVTLDDVGTVGVDASTQLTINGDLIDNTGTATGALRKVGAGTLAVRNVRLPTLAVNAGIVRFSTGAMAAGTSRVSALSVASGAQLDLSNNALVYDYTTASPIQSVRVALFDARIRTSAAIAGAAVGYAEASSIFTTFPANFAGQAVDNTTVLLIQTLAGDATLNRVVDFSDLVSLAQNYNLTNRVWRDGDFNYDGLVNFADLVALSQNYNQTAPGSVVADAFGSDFAADWALAQSMVPEPSMFALLGVAMVAKRRRR